MARQPYFVDTKSKQMEVFSSFGGGMVKQEHPSKLRDNEFVLLENVDLIAGGVATNRGGYKLTNISAALIDGMSQGVFKYENYGNDTIIAAIGGNLYKVVGSAYTKLTITGLPSGFQTNRGIEAVQYHTKLYFATGNGLVVFDGTTASLLPAYQPTGLEALYVGTNGYAADPDNFIQDNTAGAANLILGIKSDQRYGVVNKNVTFTAYVEKVPSDTLEYQFSSKYVTQQNYTVWGNWSTSSKTMAHTFGKNTDYMIKCAIRKVGTTVTLSEYVIPKFRVAATPDKKPEPTINFSDISTCTKIVLHYDRLFLYGDMNGNADHLYISHLNKFDYFPRTNIIRVTDPLRGKLQRVIQYRNFLVCFTDNSIQMITGSSPLDFAKSPIHASQGTPYGYSIQVIKNYIAFIGKDGGAYILKSFNYSTTDKLNVERIDDTIRDNLSNLVKGSDRLMSVLCNDQWYVYVHTAGVSTPYLFRYYYEYGVWVRDKINFDIGSINNIDNVMYAMSNNNGKIYQLTKGFYYDGISDKFKMGIISKDYEFNMPYHKKKLKQFQLVAKTTNDTKISITLQADNVTLAQTSVTSDVKKNGMDSQKFIVSSSGSFRYIRAVLTIEVGGLIELLGFGFVFKQSSAK